MAQANNNTLVGRLLAENAQLREQLRALEGALRETLSATESLRSLVYRDTLTGLPNRRFLDDSFRRLLSARQPIGSLAVPFVDLDDFKHVNDSIGHRSADALLRELATTLDDFIRSDEVLGNCLGTTGRRESDPSPMLSRLGGDEFVILLPYLRFQAAAGGVAERIIERVSKPFRTGAREVLITVSIGIAIYPADGETLEALIHNADTAMYMAKRNGKARYQYHRMPALHGASAGAEASVSPQTVEHV